MTIPRYARSSPENRRLSALAIVTVTCGLTPLARADDDQGASRRALLDVRREALALEERGEWVEACPMLERVAAGSPEAIAPKLELGRCWAEAGRTATAQQHFHRAAELAKERGDERATLAESKAAALEHRIPKLRLVLGDGNALARGVVVECDAVAIAQNAVGTDMPLDPGNHVVVVRAGTKVVSRKLVVLPDKDTVTSFDLPSEDPHTPMTAATSGSHWPLATTVTGAALFAVGTGFGLDGLAAERRLSDQCFGDHSCPKGVDPSADNRRKDRGLTIFIAAGGTGLGLIAAGIFGGVLSRRSPPDAVRILPKVDAHGIGLVVEEPLW